MPWPRNTAILSLAAPLPPEMIAPAWPMRLPGGAVWPAIKATTGLGNASTNISGGLFFLAAADFTDQHDRVGLLVVLGKKPEHVDERGTDDRVAADADAGRLPQTLLADLADRHVGQRSRNGKPRPPAPADGCARA